MKGEQIPFPFALPPHIIAERADKVMPVRGHEDTERKVYRWTKHSVWVVGEQVPVFGPSGRIGASIFCAYDPVFVSGREAWDFARSLVTPFLHQTAADVLSSIHAT